MPKEELEKILKKKPDEYIGQFLIQVRGTTVSKAVFVKKEIFSISIEGSMVVIYDEDMKSFRFPKTIRATVGADKASGIQFRKVSSPDVLWCIWPTKNEPPTFHLD